jgi:hypothetical protein
MKPLTAPYFAINTTVGTPLNKVYSKGGEKRERERERERQDVSERETRNVTNILRYRVKELTLINLIVITLFFETQGSHQVSRYVSKCYMAKGESGQPLNVPEINES